MRSVVLDVFSLVEGAVPADRCVLAPGTGVGAVVAFSGIVRDATAGRRVRELWYEAHAELAVREGGRILAEASTRFGATHVAAVHAVGRLVPGDVAVWVAAGAAHRDAAFAAARYLIDEIKVRVPIWKKEVADDGVGVWVGLAPTTTTPAPPATDDATHAGPADATHAGPADATHAGPADAAHAGPAGAAHAEGRTVSAAVLVVSDTVSRGDRRDRSGEVVRELLVAAGVRVGAVHVVSDDEEAVAAELKRLSDAGADVVITTGGTGLGPRDHVPEATARVLDREAPGIAETLRAVGRAHTPRAMLSRGRSGVRGRTLIVNLPGSPSAASEAMGVLLPHLDHVLEVIRGARHD